MKVLVTGATGFIGNYVVEKLLRHNHEVIASSSDPDKASKASWFNRVNYISFNLAHFSDKTDYYNYFNRPDTVLHLAWEGLPNYQSSFHEEKNLPLHIRFLSNMVMNGLNDLTVTGTCFEYGMQEGCLHEDMVTLPVNAYGKAKDGLRKSLQHLQHSYPFSLKWVRLFYMYGPGQNPNSLLSQLANAIQEGKKVFNMSGGEQVRDFLPVQTAAEYIVRVALQRRVEGIINICSGNPVTVKTFVEDYLRKVNIKLTLNLGYYPYADYEPMRFWGDNTKLQKVIKNE